jgi:hypothetical protein
MEAEGRKKEERGIRAGREELKGEKKDIITVRRVPPGSPPTHQRGKKSGKSGREGRKEGICREWNWNRLSGNSSSLSHFFFSLSQRVFYALLYDRDSSQTRSLILISHSTISPLLHSTQDLGLYKR